MSKGKGRLLPEGERPIEIVMGENIKRYFLKSDYVNLAAFAKDVKCGSKQLREVMSGEKYYFPQGNYPLIDSWMLAPTHRKQFIEYVQAAFDSWEDEQEG